MLMEKLLSKRGQISMEIGILVAAATAVATVVAYYYLRSIRQSGGSIEATVMNINDVMTNGTKNYIEKIDKVLDNSENVGHSEEGNLPGEGTPGGNSEEGNLPEEDNPEEGYPELPSGLPSSIA